MVGMVGVRGRSRKAARKIRRWTAVGGMCVGVVATMLLSGCAGGAETTSSESLATTTTSAVASTESTLPSSTTVTEATTTTLSQGDTGVAYPDIVYKSFSGLGKGQLDVEAWKATEAAKKSIEYQKNVFLYKNEMDPAVLAYWEALGIKKEMHEADDPNMKWASYTPLSALEAGNTKLYPVVFDFVGGEKLIFSAEGHGFAHIGAKEGYITICPANPVSNGALDVLTPGAQVVRILDALEAGGYPIDRARVYVVGMSAGGVATAMAGLEHPEVIAACAMHSSLAVMNTKEGGSPPFFTPPEDYAKAREYRLPLLAVAGDHDFSMFPIAVEGVVEGLNLWLQANGCPTQLSWDQCVEAQKTSTDEAVKAIGVIGDKMWTKTIDGVVHHGAEFYDSDGVKMVELVCVTNLPHWPSGSFPELAWDFLSRFSRDADGKLVIAQ